ncbi:MAG TPA: hypothetical protein VIM34_01240, partial [Burkholderiaceae bacterium]
HSGACLADVRLKVSDAQHRIVFDQRLGGLWLFIDLPPGRYELVANHKGETQIQTTTIHPGDHHQALFYFNLPAEVLAPASQPASDESEGSAKP